jgi:dTMP kinase
MNSAMNTKPKRGRFITFEGGEGSGKSTQLKLLAEKLEASGIPTVMTREPGGSPGAEVIRYMVLAGMGKLLGPDAESLLFAAARDDHVHTVIVPALEQGKWVLCDRFTDSTHVYQGKLGNVDPKLINALERVTIGAIKPDLTFILDVPVQVGLARAAKRRGNETADRFEAEDVAFHETLRAAYLQLVKDNPARCALIDANAGPDDISSRIWSFMIIRFVELAKLGRKASA